jgi:hypothetical protein
MHCAESRRYNHRLWRHCNVNNCSFPSVNIGQAAFESLAQIVYQLHKLLEYSQDEHNRNFLLASYVTYVFSAPYTLSPPSTPFYTGKSMFGFPVHDKKNNTRLIILISRLHSWVILNSSVFIKTLLDVRKTPRVMMFVLFVFFSQKFVAWNPMDPYDVMILQIPESFSYSFSYSNVLTPKVPRQWFELE